MEVVEVGTEMVEAEVEVEAGMAVTIKSKRPLPLKHRGKRFLGMCVNLIFKDLLFLKIHISLFAWVQS